MEFEYCPEQIVDEIAEKLGEADEKVLAECVEAMVYLEALCENEYNRDCFRTLYRMLEKLTLELRYEAHWNCDTKGE